MSNLYHFFKNIDILVGLIFWDYNKTIYPSTFILNLVFRYFKFSKVYITYIFFHFYDLQKSVLSQRLAPFSTHDLVTDDVDDSKQSGSSSGSSKSSSGRVAALAHLDLLSHFSHGLEAKATGTYSVSTTAIMVQHCVKWYFCPNGGHEAKCRPPIWPLA